MTTSLMLTRIAMILFQTPKSAMIWTNWFHLPFLHTKRATDNFTISLSDHEAVTSHLYLWKQS